MLPVITIGPLTVSGYAFGILGAAAGILYASLVWRRRLRDTFSPWHFINIVLITCLAGELGCRLLGAILAAPGAVFPSDASQLPAFFLDLFSNRVYYGTPLCIVLALYIYDRKYVLPHEDTFTLTFPGLPLFHALGRVGCYFAGCCYGIPVSLGPAYAGGPPRFPVQLAESLCCLILFFVLHNTAWRWNRKDMVLPLYFIGYGAVRFVLEFFRGDMMRGFWLGLSVSQWLALATAIPAGVFLLYHRQKSCRESEET